MSTWDGGSIMPGLGIWSEELLLYHGLWQVAGTVDHMPKIALLEPYEWTTGDTGAVPRHGHSSTGISPTFMCILFLMLVADSTLRQYRSCCGVMQMGGHLNQVIFHDRNSSWWSNGGLLWGLLIILLYNFNENMQNETKDSTKVSPSWSIECLCSDFCLWSDWWIWLWSHLWKDSPIPSSSCTCFGIFPCCGYTSAIKA